MEQREVVPLVGPAAADAGLVGAKAANLARCGGLGVPILPGFVVTTAGVERRRHGGLPAGLRAAWQELGGDRTALVVRSSSMVEDASTSSMAGRFTSVLDVVGWAAFLCAVDDVVRSAEQVGGAAGPQPIAVLVQRQVDAALGGVMFGVEPVTGRRDQFALDVVPARPDSLVGGTAEVGRLVLSRRGRLVSAAGPGVSAVEPSLRRRLAQLARRAERRFAGPQDIEWAVGVDGQLWLLQSRPVTAVAAGVERHEVVLGPGPVAETFPDPLSPLEQDLLLDPLRTGIVEALRLTGAVSEHRLSRSPVLVAVDGRAAVDLRLLGIVRGHVRAWDRVRPVALVRHVAVAWRVGRTRAALPELGADVVDEVDRHLSLLPDLGALDTAELVEMVDRGTRELATVHRYEVLAGMLLRPRPGAPTAAQVALDELAAARLEGLDDEAVVEERPVVLALSAPRFGPAPPLPPTRPASDVEGLSVAELDLRDALRLRTRWLQELLVRAAGELARRLEDSGTLPSSTAAELSWSDLSAVAGGAEPPEPPPAPCRSSAPLPAEFVLARDGSVRSLHHRHDGTVAGGVPAAGGRVMGTVRHWSPPSAASNAPDGAAGLSAGPTVLVVRHLEPSLAPVLAEVDGLVAETGSALSHLAILAREAGVPVVAGVERALERFPEGIELLVDGTTGEVSVAGEGPTVGASLVLREVPS